MGGFSFYALAEISTTIKNKDVVLPTFKDYTLCKEDEWWYVNKEISSDISVADILTEFKELINFYNNL